MARNIFFTIRYMLLAGDTISNNNKFVAIQHFYNYVTFFVAHFICCSQ